MKNSDEKLKNLLEMHQKQMKTSKIASNKKSKAVSSNSEAATSDKSIELILKGIQLTFYVF